MATGAIVRRTRAPYGSFDLDAAGRYVVTSSLFRGTLAVYDRTSASYASTSGGILS